MLEPLQHASIYRTVQEALNTPLYLRCGRSLNYVIVRGTYSEQIVIFNAFSLNGEIVRRLRTLAEKVRSSQTMVIAAFIYFDPSRSGYYLETEKPSNTFQLKKLSGYSSFRLVIDEKKYQVPPASFSQVNQSLLPILAKSIRDELTPGKNRRLLDVYCGYGFFSHYLSNDYREITGIDAASGSIEAAKANARYNPHCAKLTFKTFTISGGNLGRILPPAPAAGYEDVILDPPKSGVDNKTIEYIASRYPQKVIHIFCGIDEIPHSLKTWEACGYCVGKIIPLDMFAGTGNIETIAVLGPEKSN
jgi:SAM-dependent methyltransferase